MLNMNLLSLNCVRASLRGTLSRNDVREPFGKAVEWDRLLEDAQISGIGPLLYHILREADVDGLLPGWVMSKLEMEYYSALTHNIFYYRELSDILSSFQRSGVQAIILKGMALAETLYPDISLRPFGDMDLLIRDQDLPRAESELQRLGYEKYVEEFRQGYGREFEKYFAYVKRGSVNVYVDLHTCLLRVADAQRADNPLFPSDKENGFWDRAVVAQIGENTGLVLSPEDTVLHLCVHVFRHGSSIRLLWLYDLALIILKHGESLNWKLIEERARTLGVYGIVGFVLDQVRQTLDIPLPRGAASWAESYELDRVEKFSSINESSCKIWYYAMRLRSVKGMKGRLRYIIGRALPSREYIMWRYLGTTSAGNPKLVFFGYCCHFYRLYSMFLGAARAAFALVYKRRLSRQST